MMIILKTTFHSNFFDMQTLFWIYGWLFVRPRRWLFFHMVWNDRLNWKVIKNYYYRDKLLARIKWPNLHWWLLRVIIFEPLKWLYWDGWRKFGKNPYRGLGGLAKRIGQTTAGFAIGGGECYHCGSEHGDPVELSSEEGEAAGYFELTRTWELFCGEYTDYRFCGITTCPRCGYQQYYEDGSA